MNTEQTIQTVHKTVKVQLNKEELYGTLIVQLKVNRSDKARQPAAVIYNKAMFRREVAEELDLLFYNNPELRSLGALQANFVVEPEAVFWDR